MTLLDRFRTQSRDKHPDPAVRLAFVADVPIEERQTIAAIAREDEDPRVRRAAVGKLMDPTALAEVAGSDGDEGVRSQALQMLRDIALEAFEGIAEGDSLEAVDAVTEPRVLAQIAKASSREIVALRAVSRVSDPHVLGSIARHAVLEPARRDAFALVSSDQAEVLAIALNSEFKDTAVAAVDALAATAGRPALEQVSLRSRNKNAVKRARTLMREADEAAAAAAAADAAAAREAALAASIGRADAPVIASKIADVSPEVVDAGNPAAATHPGAEAVDDPAADERRRQADAEAAARQAQAHAAAEEAARLDSERRAARLAALADVAEQAAAGADLPLARRQLATARREWTALAAHGEVDAALAARFEAADTRLRERDEQAREADQRARREALARMQQLVTRVTPLHEKADLTLKAGERALRDIRSALGAVPPLPRKEDFDEITTKLKAALDALSPKVQELREADDWQRFANVAIQEQLCARMEALRAATDLDAAAREVRELQQQWRAAADVPRAQADALWRRFKAAHDEVWARCEAHFAADAEARSDNLARKLALCERAEALSDSTSWLQTAEEFKKLQAEWKAVGPVSRGREKATWDRFRTACDRFFTRRHDDLAQRKTVWAENLAKKDALCARAEALADSTDWEPAAAEIRRLQAEWKTVGPVKKSRSEAIWQRFRAACDRFFTRYAQRHDLARAERVAAREAICAELEALGSAESADNPLETVRGLRTRWQQEHAARGVDPDRARALDERFAAALATVQARWPDAFANTDLDPAANRRRMEGLVSRVEELAGAVAGRDAADADGALTPATRLAAMLKEALAANTIGGKAHDDARLRAAVEEVRQAQSAWSRLPSTGGAPSHEERELAGRFRRACARVMDRAAAAGAATGGPKTGGGGPSRGPNVNRSK